MKLISLIAMFILVFSLGFAAASAMNTNLAIPMSFVQPFVTGQAIEKMSPSDHVGMDKISVNSDGVILDIKNTRWVTFADTNSMDPLFDAGHFGIEIVPESIDEISIGDVISYESKYGTIIHRVISIGIDQNGWYAIAKGDNNPVSDPDKVRFEQIKGVLVAVIY